MFQVYCFCLAEGQMFQVYEYDDAVFLFEWFKLI